MIHNLERYLENLPFIRLSTSLPSWTAHLVNPTFDVSMAYPQRWNDDKWLPIKVANRQRMDYTIQIGWTDPMQFWERESPLLDQVQFCSLLNLPHPWLTACLYFTLTRKSFGYLRPIELKEPTYDDATSTFTSQYLSELVFLTDQVVKLPVAPRTCTQIRRCFAERRLLVKYLLVELHLALSDRPSVQYPHRREPSQFVF